MKKEKIGDKVQAFNVRVILEALNSHGDILATTSDTRSIQKHNKIKVEYLLRVVGFEAHTAAREAKAKMEAALAENAE